MEQQAAQSSSPAPQAVRKRLHVFCIKQMDGGGSVWVRAGVAWLNRDGSLQVSLDALPLDGKLHIREPGGRSDYLSEQQARGASITPRSSPGPVSNSNPNPNRSTVVEPDSMGGH